MMAGVPAPGTSGLYACRAPRVVCSFGTMDVRVIRMVTAREAGFPEGSCSPLPPDKETFSILRRL